MNKEREAFLPDPLFSSLVGLGPSVIAARSLPEGLVLGLCAALATALLAASSALVAPRLDPRARPPFALLVAAASALLVVMVVEAIFPLLALSLDFYLPLTALSPMLIHGMRRSYGKSSASPWLSLVEAGLFALSLTGFGALRELLGRGSLSLPSFGFDSVRLVIFPAPPLILLATPAGSLLLLGLLVALVKALRRATGRSLP